MRRDESTDPLEFLGARGIWDDENGGRRQTKLSMVVRRIESISR